MPFDSNRYRRQPPPNQQRGLDLLADAIYDARTERGITQHDLAFRTGVPQSTISRLEHGLAPGVSARRLGALILVLGGIRLGPRPLTPSDLAGPFPPNMAEGQRGDPERLPSRSRDGSRD